MHIHKHNRTRTHTQTVHTRTHLHTHSNLLYPTKSNRVGVVEYSDMEKISIADIPGLVDGASEDKGLGHDFLRHVERTKVKTKLVGMK